MARTIKLFISQPMNGRADKEIIAERKKAEEKVKSVIDSNGMTTEYIDVDVIDSFFQNAPVEAKPLWFLGKSLELLSTADYVYFCKGWRNARGCQIEHEAACKYGIQIIYESEE